MLQAAVLQLLELDTSKGDNMGNAVTQDLKARALAHCELDNSPECLRSAHRWLHSRPLVFFSFNRKWPF